MSRILKASELPESASGRFSFDDWGSASAQSAALRCEAEAMLAAARSESERIRQEAHEQGLAAARSEFDALVEQAAQLKFEGWLPTLQAAVAELAANKATWLAEWERAGVRVATAIAGRIVRREIERTPQIALTLVREALELATAGDAQLRMHPDDVNRMGAQVEQLLGELGRAGAVTLVPDAGISRGGCRLETRLGTIDQQIESQLARIEEELH